MIVLASRAELDAWRDRVTTSLAFVPTMGALHEGHASLFREARRHGGTVIVSIFVNPTQFNDPKDFEKYPRTFDADLETCRAAGVDAVFAPTVADMYPAGASDPSIPLPAVALPLEGALRPGHFEGVVTVVAKLFRLVRPTAALFGLKDYQQVRVIQEMTRKQRLPVTIIPCPIVRSTEGLALSSRNARLSPEGLVKALRISAALRLAQNLFANGTKDASSLEGRLRDFLSQDSALKIDAVDVVDAETLRTPRPGKPLLVAVAVFVEGVRLIDNCLLG